MDNHELYMHRCLELAKSGAGYVAPNPMVGAVLVNNEKIIGEGYHQQFGKAHAEVNCINSVSAEDRHLINSSTLYVSLEPCNHFGKTPPCTDLILKHEIKKVVIGCTDPFEKVKGTGIEKLKQNGVSVVTNILQERCEDLNKRFFTFHTKERPYIILKWAQSSNQKISNADRSRVLISNELSNRLVHKWRSEEAGIMVGTSTALNDDPALDVRLWEGKSPVRLVLDMNLRLPPTLKMFSQSQSTIVFNSIKDQKEENLIFHRIKNNENVIEEILKACYHYNIQSILVEGGTKLLQSFIDAGLWDEARIIQNNQLVIDDGLAAPQMKGHELLSMQKLLNDSIFYYKNTAHT